MNDMNEKCFFDWYFPNYGKMPELTSAEEIREKEGVAGYLRWYSTPSKEFDKFLLERFGYNIEGFRKFYLRKHMDNFSEDEISRIAKYTNPIPKNIRAYFGEVHSLNEMISRYKLCKEMIEAHSCSEPLPLHDDTISNFTIIRANFSKLKGDPENLEKVKKEYFLGYYFSTEKFRFIISSSTKLDLTVIYEEI